MSETVDNHITTPTTTVSTPPPPTTTLTQPAKPQIKSPLTTKVLKDKPCDETSPTISPRPPDEPHPPHPEIHHGGLHHDQHTVHPKGAQSSIPQPIKPALGNTQPTPHHATSKSVTNSIVPNHQPIKAVMNNYRGKAQQRKDDHMQSHDITINGADTVSYDGTTPEPSVQKDIITGLDNECTCTYSVLRTWYRKWEEYVGIHKSASAANDPPGPIDMDTQNDSNNEYINEEAWRYFIKWYGISPNHQLDRKHLYFKDEKMFDVCMLSPFSGIVEHSLKKFNRFEEIGYIECQLRRIFHIPNHKRTRLWISEKAQVPRFRQLLLRFRMLNDCIHRDKVYILALEEGLSGNGWPTGEPGEPKGELTKYAEIVTGHKPEDHWSCTIENDLDTLSVAVSENIRNMAEAFLQNGRDLIQERESVLENIKRTLEKKLEETKTKENFLNDKIKEVTKQEEKLKQDRAQLEKERKDFEFREQKFKDEIAHMEEVNKIQESKVKLDIGGQIHTTSLQTLRRDPDSMLAAMFSGRHELHQETDGSYFVDRDGTYFRYVLNFLRDGTIETGTLPSKVYALREILREAKYYQLAGLVQFLEDIIHERSSGSSIG